MAGVVGPPDIGAATSGTDIPNCANISMPFHYSAATNLASLDNIGVDAVRGSVPPPRRTWQDA
jgi:hypothetical protein